MLRLENLTRRLPGRILLDGLFLHLPPGGAAVIRGPSGCGKTTLLRLIAGLDRPDAGRILIGGEAVTDGAWLLPPWQRGIGMAFQDDGLWPHLTVRQHLEILTPLAGPTSDAVTAAGGSPAAPGPGVALLPPSGSGPSHRATVLSPLPEAETLLADLGLAALADRYPATLSGGEARRVSVARALAAAPRVLLLDEPLAHLDAASRTLVEQALLRHACRPGRATLVVSHETGLDTLLGARLLEFAAGRLEEPGASGPAGA